MEARRAVGRRAWNGDDQRAGAGVVVWEDQSERLSVWVFLERLQRAQRVQAHRRHPVVAFLRRLQGDRPAGLQSSDMQDQRARERGLARLSDLPRLELI